MTTYCKKPRRMNPTLLQTKCHALHQKLTRVETQTIQRTQQISQDPIEFCKTILGFTPYPYQTQFINLFQNNQFTAARWCRQSGKSHIISALLLWHAITHPNNAIGIIGPSWRQTKRIINRITNFTHKLPPNLTLKPQKTQINLQNGSTIEAFPNNPETIRGPTLNLIYCLAPYMNVSLANGNRLPICKLKPGQKVLSYSKFTNQIEPKRIRNVYMNSIANRKILQIFHPTGILECTSEHKIYTKNRGYVPAEQINADDILFTPKGSTYVRKIVAEQGLSYPVVFNLEIEDNHNFFAQNVLVSNCDEMNFIANDQELYDAILYTLITTEGKFVCASTPWNTDSIFYKIFYHKNFSDFKTSHITYEQALTPNGPLKPSIIEKIKTQMGEDRGRWRREMLAEWAEDDDVWLTQSLIANCIGTTKTCGTDLQEYDPEKTYEAEFFAGLDLAQTRDYTVLAVIERQNDILYLRHLKIFKQPTMYAQVLVYLKTLQDRWGGFQKIRVDFTREGPSIINDMTQASIENAEGVTFSIPRKSEMAHLLRARMANGQFFYPMIHWERPYRGDLCTELNVERYEQRKDGQINYYHPTGTHDDVYWAIALAVYATTNMTPEPALMLIPR